MSENAYVIPMLTGGVGAEQGEDIQLNCPN